MPDPTYEEFTVRLPEYLARRLRFYAAEQGTTPEAYIANATAEFTISDAEGIVLGRERENKRTAAAVSLNIPSAGMEVTHV